MRSVSSGIATALTAQGQRPGYLVKIALSSGTIRLSSIGSFTYSAESYVAADVQVTGLSWDGTASRSATVMLGDPASSPYVEAGYVDEGYVADVPGSAVYWNSAVAGEFADALIWIWRVYSAATTEAEAVFYGRCGRLSRSGAMTVVECHNDALLKKSPRTLLQYTVDPVFLIPPGTVITIGSQLYTIQRKTK